MWLGSSRRSYFTATLEMAFDERLAERIRSSLGRRKGFAEKKMFGGVGRAV